MEAPLQHSKKYENMGSSVIKKQPLVSACLYLCGVCSFPSSYVSFRGRSFQSPMEGVCDDI